MINEATIQANREYIIIRLKEINRVGMPGLIQELDDLGFFRSPCSTKYHGAYTGGLAQHSLDVFGKFVELTSLCGVFVPADSAVIACILHDLCKAGAYVGNAYPYTYRKEHPNGHAALSFHRISKFIELTPLESDLIRYHMGLYGTHAHSVRGEYGVDEFMAARENPAVKLMCFADELVTLQEKATEKEHIEKYGSLLPAEMVNGREG